jgi:hypothetical protein
VYGSLYVTDETEPRNMLRKLLPRCAKEGDYLQLEIEDGRIIKGRLDLESTQAAKERINNKLDRLKRGEHLDNFEAED